MKTGGRQVIAMNVVTVLLSMLGAVSQVPAQDDLLKIQASDGATGDRFGEEIAIDGDVLVVGAIFHDGSWTDSGAAYVFRRQGDAWLEESELVPSSGSPASSFGEAVAVEGDLVVVGFAGYSGGRGAAFVYVHDGVTWREQATLAASDGTAGDNFGRGVAVSGDRVLVGSHHWGNANPGAAYVFRRSGSEWVEEATLQPSDLGAYDYFGSKVELDGDVAVVTAIDYGISAGAAYVFRRTGSTWSQEAKLIPADNAAGDRFGADVSLDGDLLVIGAHGNDDLGGNSGCAYIYRYDGLAWREEAKLLPLEGGPDYEFGFSVAVRRDIAVVGAPKDSKSGWRTGSAFVFRWSGGSWTQTQRLLPPDSASGDWSGVDTAIGSDLVAVSKRSEGGAVYLWKDADGDGVPDQVDSCTDTDRDGFGNPGFPASTCIIDSCPAIANPDQSNVDVDGAGDVCDACPADPLDSCNATGSVAQEIPPGGGTVVNPDGSLTLEFPPGAISVSTTISATETVFNDPSIDLVLATGTGKGARIRVYDLQPDNATFAAPVNLEIVNDVSTLNEKQRAYLNVYLENAAGDLEPIPGAACTVANGVATCTAQITHFSVYALVAPFDGDGDGLFDLFDGLVDVCPAGPNVIEGFLSPLAILVPDGVPVVFPENAFKIGRTLPMKLDYRCGTVPLTDLDGVTPPQLLAVWRIGDPEPVPIADLDSGEASDNGVWFRYSGEHWVYNYKTTGLTQGTYHVGVRMPDGRVLKGGFVLR